MSVLIKKKRKYVKLYLFKVLHMKFGDFQILLPAVKQSFKQTAGFLQEDIY